MPRGCNTGPELQAAARLHVGTVVGVGDCSGRKPGKLLHAFWRHRGDMNELL